VSGIEPHLDAGAYAVIHIVSILPTIHMVEPHILDPSREPSPPTSERMAQFGASSSGGLTGGAKGLVGNGSVKAGGLSLGGGLLSGFSGSVTATNYTNPLQLGKFWAFTPIDLALYSARQACK
jgi:hypothetical protein